MEICLGTNFFKLSETKIDKFVNGSDIVCLFKILNFCGHPSKSHEKWPEWEKFDYYSPTLPRLKADQSIL